MFVVDDALLAAAAAAAAESAAAGAAGAGAASAGAGALGAGAMEGASLAAPAAIEAGMTPAQVAAAEGMQAPMMAPELANARMSEFAMPSGSGNPMSTMSDVSQGNVGGLIKQPMQDMQGMMPDWQGSIKNWSQGNVGAELENVGEGVTFPGGPKQPNPIKMLGIGGDAPPMPAPQLPAHAPSAEMPLKPPPPVSQASSLLDADWKGMADKAQSFVKLANQVQDFGAKMRGEPNPNSKISEVAPRPAPATGNGAMPISSGNTAGRVGEAAMPATRLMGDEPMSAFQERLRMLRGY